MRKFIKISVTLTLFVFLGGITDASPVSNEQPNELESLESNITTTLQSTVTSIMTNEGSDVTDTRVKARECTLKALKAIVSESEEFADEECRELLRGMIKNAGNQKDKNSENVVDLRKELKELALQEVRFEDMNDEIDQAQNLLAEKRFADAQSENKALLKVESKMKTPYSGIRDNDEAEMTGSNKINQVSNKVFAAELDDDIVEPEKSGFQEGKFLVNDAGIGLLEGPEKANHDSIDDDFLVIPLRFLRKEMLAKQNVGREKERSSEVDPEMNDRKPNIANDEVTATWLLRSILNMLSRDQEDGINVSKSDTLALDGAIINENDNELAKENTLAQDPDNSSDYEKERPMNHIREMNSGIFDRVEKDISKLGKDLRQLQYANDH